MTKGKKIGLVLLVVVVVFLWAVWKYYEWREATRDPIKLARQLVTGLERQTEKPPFAQPKVETPAVPVKTDNVYPLPPDPGPEGMKTLLGIDSNHNGVRDDIERFIVQKYGDSERVREALFDYARTDSGYLTASTRSEAIQVSQKVEDAMACLIYVMGWERLLGGIEKWIQASRELEAFSINTPERARASQKTDELLAWHGSDGRTKDGSTCSFEPQSLKN